MTNQAQPHHPPQKSFGYVSTVITQIKEAEDTSQAILTKAHLEKEKIMQHAQAEAIQLKTAILEDARKKGEQEIEEFRKQCNEHSQNRAEKAKRDAAALISRASKRQVEGVNLVMKKIEDAITHA